MLAHHKHIATTPGRKRTRPKVRQIGPSAALRRLPDPLHRAARRALPKEPICSHQIFPIYQEPLWASDGCLAIMVQFASRR